MTRYRITSKDPEPEGWGTRTDEIEATPATLWAVFNDLGRWAQRQEIVNVEEIPPVRANPHKKCIACGGKVEKDRQRAQQVALERRKSKAGGMGNTLPPAEFRELVDSLDKCEACAKPPPVEMIQTPVRPFLNKRQDMDELRDRRRKRKKTAPLADDPIRVDPIPGEADKQASLIGHLRPRLKPAGSRKLQNPWDKKPRDRGRRDFEAPTETKALNSRQRALDSAPDPMDVVNRQAAGSA